MSLLPLWGGWGGSDPHFVPPSTGRSERFEHGGDDGAVVAFESPVDDASMVVCFVVFAVVFDDSDGGEFFEGEPCHFAVQVGGAGACRCAHLFPCGEGL